MSNLTGIIKSIRNDMREDRGVSGDGQRIEQLGWMLFLKIFDDKDKELELMDDTYKSPIPEIFKWRNWAADDEGVTGDELLNFLDQQLFPTLKELSTHDPRAYMVREVFEGSNNYMKSGINIRKVCNKLNQIDFNKATERHLFGEIYETILQELQSAGDYGEFYTPRAITQFIVDIINPKLGEKILDPACGTGGYLTCAIDYLKSQSKNINQYQTIQQTVRGWEWKPLPYVLAITNLILHDVELPDITYRDALDKPLSEYREKDRVDIIIANPPFGGTVANNNETNFPQNFRVKESADLFLILMMHLLKQGGRAGIVLPDGSLSGDGVKQRIRQKLLEDCNLHTIIRLPNSVFKPYATVATNLLFFEKGKPTNDIWYYQHKYPEGVKSYSKTNPLKLEELDPIKHWWKNRFESEVSWKVCIEDIKERGYDLDIKNPNTKADTNSKNTFYFIDQLQSDLADINSEIEEIIDNLTTINDYEFKSLGELCDVVKGKTGIKKAISGDYPLVTTSHERGTHNNFQFNCEAVCIPLVSSSGHGHASLKRVHYQNGKFALGSILAAAIPKNNKEISTKYLYYYLNNFKDDLIVPLMKGMANVSLSVAKIQTIKVVIPPMDKQLSLIYLMEKCENLRNTLSKSSEDAENIIKSALHDAFKKEDA